MKRATLFLFFVGLHTIRLFGQHLLVLDSLDPSSHTRVHLSEIQDFRIDSLVPHPDGHIYVLTSTRENPPFGSRNSALWRILGDGSLDPSFGSGGQVKLPSEARQVFLQKDGNLLLCGSALFRLAPDGTLLGAALANYEAPESVRIFEQSNGNIIFSNGQCFTADGRSEAEITGRIQQWYPAPPDTPGIILAGIDEHDRIYLRTVNSSFQAGPLQRLQPDGTEDREYRGPAVDALVQSPDRGLIGLVWREFPQVNGGGARLIGYDLEGTVIFDVTRNDLAFLGSEVIALRGDRYLFWGNGGSSGGGVQCGYRSLTIDKLGRVWAVSGCGSDSWGDLLPADVLVRLSIPPVCSIRKLNDREIQIMLIGAAAASYGLQTTGTAGHDWLPAKGVSVQTNGDMMLSATNSQPSQFYRALRTN